MPRHKEDEHHDKNNEEKKKEKREKVNFVNYLVKIYDQLLYDHS